MGRSGYLTGLVSCCGLVAGRVAQASASVKLAHECCLFIHLAPGQEKLGQQRGDRAIRQSRIVVVMIPNCANAICAQAGRQYPSAIR